MTYFPDLSPYRYLPEAGNTAVNVGWLAEENSFPTGEAPDGLVAAVLERVRREPVNRMRGFHECEFCPEDDEYYPAFIEHEGQRVYLGDCEIWVTGDDGTVYAAPSLIAHYIREHRYLPPEGFVDALIG
jgi:hypothetical protein